MKDRFTLVDSESLVNLGKESINVIMIFHDSRDWALDIQIICDLLQSGLGRLETTTKIKSGQSMPIYFSNSDFVWSTDFPLSRFAQV